MKYNIFFVLLVLAAFVLAVWSNNWLYFLTIIGAAGILIALPNVHLVLTSEGELPFKSVDHPLHDYVSKAKNAGMEKDEIEVNLKQSGWEDHEIHLALLHHELKQKESSNVENN